MEEENPNSRGSGLAEVLALLGYLHAKQGKFYEAEREYREAEDAYNKIASFATSEYYGEIARIMSARADIYFEVQEWKAAENTYNDSLRLYKILMAPTPYGYGAGYAHTLMNLSKLYKVTNRFDEAEKGYREVIELYRAFVARFPNEFDAKLATTLNSLACLLFEKSQYGESEKAFEEAISILRRLEDTDENANSLANALNGLGNVYAVQNSPFLAEQKYSETVDVYRRLIAKGLDDWDYDLMLANTLRHLASQRVKLARDEEAGENYLEALAIAQENNEDEYAFFIAETSFALATFYAEHGRFADAEVKFADALAILRRIDAAQPGCCALDLAFALVNLSGCRHRLGRHAEAKQGLQEALEIYRAFEKDRPGQFTGIIEDATRLLNEVRSKMETH